MTSDTLMMVLIASAIVFLMTLVLILLGKYDDIPTKENKWPQIKDQECKECPYRQK